jgi:hypothetical protein
MGKIDVKSEKISVDIDFSECDLEEMLEGREFNWTFPANNGQEVDVRLFKQL